MEKVKVVQIAVVNPDTGELYGSTQKCVVLSTTSEMDGNKLLVNWLNSYIRGLNLHKSLVMQVTATDFVPPKQLDIF